MPDTSLHDRFRHLTVGDVHRRLTIDPITVRASTTMREIAELAARSPMTRVVAVVDDDGRLIGIVPLRMVSIRVLSSVLPELALRLTSSTEGMAEFEKAIRGDTAGDIMADPAGLPTTMSLGDAFQRLVTLRVDGLPVVDDQNRVIGYLDAVEVLLAWLRLKEQGAS